MLNISLCDIILNYKNIILTMISIKLCLLSVSLNFMMLLLKYLNNTIYCDATSSLSYNSCF